MSEVVSGLAGLGSTLAFIWLFHYLRERRRVAGALARREQLLIRSSLSVPVEYEDAGTRNLSQITGGLSGTFKLKIIDGVIDCEQSIPGMLGPPEVFWNRILNEAREGSLPHKREQDDVYVLASIPFPVNGKAALRFVESDWDMVLSSQTPSTK